MSFGKGSFQVANYVHQYERPSNFAILLCLNIVIWLGFYSSTTFSTFFRPKSTADTFVQYKTNNASLNSQDTSPERPFDSLWWPNRHNSVESEMIYNNQFPETCDDKKFLVFRLDKMGSRNIGSIVSQIAHWFEEVMVSKRVFIFAHDWEQANECESKTWDCFFMPISSCSVSDIRNLSACVEPNRNKTRQDPWNAEKNEQCVFVSRAYWRHGGKLIKNILKLENFGWRELRFRAYTYAFFFRHNDRLRKRVESNIQDLLRRNQIDSSKTVSMPIRGSDKCLDHDIKGSASGEVRCTPVSKFVLRLREYQKFYFPNDADIIDTVIVTSEDSNMVEKAVEHGEKMGYRMIVNDFDVMQGTGSANDLTGHKNTTNFDVMVSVFTGFQLLLRSEFFVAYMVKLQHYSSWHFIMLEMRKEIKDMNPKMRLRPRDIAYVEPRFDNWWNVGEAFLTGVDNDCAFENQADCIHFMGSIKSSFTKHHNKYELKLLKPGKGG